MWPHQPCQACGGGGRGGRRRKTPKRAAVDGGGAATGGDRQGHNPADGAPRNWTVWPGNNRFFLDGRLMAGPYLRPVAVTAALIFVPVVVHFAAGANPYYVSRGGAGAWVSTLVGLFLAGASLGLSTS